MSLKDAEFYSYWQSRIYSSQKVIPKANIEGKKPTKLLNKKEKRLKTFKKFTFYQE